MKLRKGSRAAKAYMAKLRELRRKRAAGHAWQQTGVLPSSPKTRKANAPVPGSRIGVEVWEERDRLHIHAVDRKTGKTVAEWWDDDARQMFEDGFFRRGRELEPSVREYLRDVRIANPLVSSESAQVLDAATDDLLHVRRLRKLGRGGKSDKALEAYLYGKAAAAGFIAGMNSHNSEHSMQGLRLFRVAQRLGTRAVKQDLQYHEALKRGENPMDMLILGNPGRARSPWAVCTAAGVPQHTAKMRRCAAHVMGNPPTPGSVATVTYNPEFQEFKVTTRDAARRVLGTYFTNDHADALATARAEGETVKDSTKRRPPNPLTMREVRGLRQHALGHERFARKLVKGGAKRAGIWHYGYAKGVMSAAVQTAARGKVALVKAEGRQTLRAARGMKRAMNPAPPCPKGCPPHLWADPAFRAEYAVYRKRHGDGPIELRQVSVPHGFPKFLSVYGRVPELKYDAPKHSTKGRRIHRFGKRGQKSTMPFAVTSASRGPKFLALVSGTFKAKPDWIFD